MGKGRASTLPRRWHKFDIVDGRTLLFSKYSQHHKRFTPKSRGLQGPCNCLIATAFSNFYTMQNWTQDTMHQILDLGNKHYVYSWQMLSDRCRTKLQLGEVQPTFFVADNKVTMALDGERYTGKLFEDVDNSPHLANVIDDFFNDNTCGVVSAQGRYWGVWEQEGAYFLFDPGEHDCVGKPWKGVPGLGVAFCQRLSSTEDLVEVIHEHVSRKNNSRFELLATPVLRTTRINTKPPDTIHLRHCEEVPPKEEKLPLPIPPPLPPPPPKEKIIEVTNVDDKFFPEDEADELSPELREGPKKVSDSKVIQPPLRVESVLYFQPISDDVQILRASTYQGDPRFSKYKGKQSLANAVAAIVMLRVEKSKHWIKKILDGVLLLAEEIHANTLSQMQTDVMKVTTMTRRISLKDKVYTPDADEFTVVGQLGSRIPEILDLLPALKDFFKSHDHCVLTGPLTLAIWEEDECYYMYDPNERDEKGMVVIKSIQVGSQLRVLDFTPGVACLTRFTDLKDLVKIYMRNVDKENRRDRFILSRLTINDFVKLPDSWNNFQGIANIKWIIRGTFSQNDRRFDKDTRNNQCTAMAALCIAYQKLKHVKMWGPDDIDEILIQGDNYYKQCVQSLQDQGKYVGPHLMVDELQRRVALEGVDIELEILDCLVNGLLDAQDDNDVYNLMKGMQEFLKDNDYGILTARGISVAIMKVDEIFYYFDSHSRDDKGFVAGFGRACILRVLNVADLAKCVEGNLGAGTNQVFNISRISVKVWEAAENGISRPPMNNFTEVNATTAILRSMFSERSPEFDVNVGKQTIPMCLISVGMQKLIPALEWSRDNLDQVLVLGDKLYTKTMVKRDEEPIDEKDDIDEVYADAVIRDFHIGVNQFVINYRGQMQGNFAQDFVSAMEAFLSENKDDETDQRELLVTSDVYNVMTWKDKGVYYLFDPKPRDENGQVFGKDEWTLQMSEEEGEDVTFGSMRGAGDYDGGSAGKASQQEKHSLNYWRAVEDSDGKGCVMWFTNPDDLIRHILNNTPPTKRVDLQFTLYHCEVNNTPDVKKVLIKEDERIDSYHGDWYLYKELDHGRWVVRGTITYSSSMFPPHNRGRQSVAIAYVALAFAKKFVLSAYNANSIDSIIKYGDRLHTSTRRKYEKAIMKHKNLGLSDAELQAYLNKMPYGVADTAPKFCVGKDQARIEVTQDVVTGDLRAKDGEEVLNISGGLAAFFSDHRAGIIQCKGFTLSIWKGATVYYMFDPGSCSPSGMHIESGLSCLLRFLRLGDMADVFINNLPTDGSNAFQIHRVGIRIAPCPREPKPEEKERIEERPKFQSYIMTSPGKNILRGTISQEDPKFNRGKNAQSATIAVVALTMTLIHKASTWTKPIVDEVVIYGDELYTATLDKLGFEYNPWERGLTLHLVNKDYKVGVIKANCELRTMDQRGVIEIKHPKIQNLRQGIERFFDENTHGVIETETLTCAIWEEEDQPDYIYMFDPNPRGPAGCYFPGGSACVITFESALMAAQHFTNNVDKSKRNGEFVITPMEIVVAGGKRSPPKKAIDPCKKHPGPLEKVCSPTECEKKKLRKMAEEKRQKKEAARIAKIGRNEFHELSNGDAILRGSKNQNWSGFSDKSRNNQDIANCFAAFVIHRMVPINQWHFKHIDYALTVGDQLYQDSYITYAPTLKPNPKLGFENMLRKLFIKDVAVTLKVYKPVMKNVLTPFNLELALINYFQQEMFGIISTKNEHSAVFFKQGLYYLFNPQGCSLEGGRCSSGPACVLRFEEIPNLVKKYVDYFCTVMDQQEQFTITLVVIGSITKNGVPQPLT